MRLRPNIPSRPSIRMEKDYSARHGGAVVAGIDEAGRGPLAGPVVAAAVILSLDGKRPGGLRDSKELSHDQREALYPQIRRLAISYGIGIATAQEIDLYNILEATRIAARRAIAQLDPQPEILLTDCLEIPAETRQVVPIIKGDMICASISAASILAKVTRDRLMCAYGEEFPHFSWHSNKGYPTPDHYEALERHGATTLHRLTFSGVSFFDAAPARSPSYHRIHQRIEAIIRDRQTHSLLALRVELNEISHRLPPPDIEDLIRRLDSIHQDPAPCASAPPFMLC
ncbi:hypothetical protein BH09SUM1_BH09SUM1_07480 [soil metagenome]